MRSRRQYRQASGGWNNGLAAPAGQRSVALPQRRLHAVALALALAAVLAAGLMLVAPPAAAEPRGQTASADLAISKSSSPVQAVPGELLTYGLSIRNLGPGTAVNVVVQDALPADVDLISATPETGSCNGSTCELGDIPSGEQRTIAVVVQVPENGADEIRNTACVSSDTPDPVNANNCVELVTSVSRPSTPTPTPTPTPAVAPEVSPPAPVDGVPPTGGLPLPDTGTQWLLTAAIAAIMLLAGGIILVAARLSRPSGWRPGS
jgi:uncharacterized repeat protein (TIGR01451 family)